MAKWIKLEDLPPDLEAHNRKIVLVIDARYVTDILDLSFETIATEPETVENAFYERVMSHSNYGLPRLAQLCGFWWNPDPCALHFLLKHRSFDPVKPGERAPLYFLSEGKHYQDDPHGY